MVVAVICSAGGVTASSYADAAPGPTIVLPAIALLLLAAPYSALRTRITGRLAAIGVAAVSDAAIAEDGLLSAGGSPAVLRIVAREDLVVAREAARIVGSGPG